MRRRTGEAPWSRKAIWLIMVLESRPQATLVAFDLFGESFDRHFGRSETPQQRLLA